MIGQSEAWRASWRLANARRLAQAIGELCFEGVLTAEAIADGRFRVRLQSGVEYRFFGQPSAWGGVHVERESIERWPAADQPPTSVDSPIQLLLDARHELDAEPEVLSGWLEEIHNSLLAEARQCEALRNHDATSLAALDGVELERYLDGHPKLIAHRGRLGWGVEDASHHAPECGPAEFRLHWLIVAPELARCSGAAEQGHALIDECCDPSERERLRASVAANAPQLADRGVLIPVHPWQWQRRIAAQYGRWLGAGSIASLGRFGDRYAPRMSLRTLSNVGRPDRADLKLALTVLNTSCWRGLPGRDVARAAAVGAALRELVAADPQLAQVRILTDLGGVHVPQPDFESLGAAPYRVRELLGAIWRESARSRLAGDEAEVPAAALHQCDLDGVPLVRPWVDRSGMSLVEWLRVLFELSAVPLYHLLCAHGLGVIAHGQNLGLVLRDGRPSAIVLRDFHGDLRRRERVAQPSGSALEQLSALPDEHVLHDLYTGYFVSVLRFVAPVIERGFGLPESQLLALLRGCLRRYQDQHPELSESFVQLDLWRPTMARICLNRARLRANPDGRWGGGQLRPLPVLGPSLQNPLHQQLVGG